MPGTFSDHQGRPPTSVMAKGSKRGDLTWCRAAASLTAITESEQVIVRVHRRQLSLSQVCAPAPFSATHYRWLCPSAALR